VQTISHTIIHGDGGIMVWGCMYIHRPKCHFILLVDKTVHRGVCPISSEVHWQAKERGYCASVEREAGSGDFESGEQELTSEF
jgi:hypothetical protein